MSSISQHRLGERKRKRPSQESTFDQEITWTTARCSRLLRTINSRIEAIRQLLQPDVRKTKPAPKPQTRSTRVKTDSQTDPAWLPNGAKKPTTRTYAGQRKAKVARTVRDGATSEQGQSHKITLPSPFLRKVQNPDSLPVPSSPIQPCTFPDQDRPRKPLRLPVKIEDPTQKAEAALCTAFRSFLGATRETAPVSRRGARSLLQMSLSKVPEYLELGEEGQDFGCDVVDELWAFFDDLLEIKGPGWHGLREVVRSQGVNAVRWAVFDDVLSDRCVETLVTECIAQGALRECEEMLVDWLQRSENLIPEKLRCVRKLAERHHAWGARFRIWSRYIEQASSRFPVLATADTSLWQSVLNAVPSGVHDEALSFLQTAIECCILNGCATQASVLKTTTVAKNLDEVVSMLLTLASISELLVEGEPTTNPLQEGLSRLAGNLLTHECPTLATIDGSWILGPVILSALTQKTTELDLSNHLLLTFDQTTRSLSNRRDVLKREQQFAALLTSELFTLQIDKSVGIIDPFLRGITSYIKGHQKTATTRLLRALTTEICTRARIENVTLTHSLTSKSPLRPSLSSTFLATPGSPIPRFTWNDNLCEFIAKTPFPRRQQNPSLPNASSSPPPAEAVGAGKENLLPETPDVLAPSTIKKEKRRRVAFVRVPPAPEALKRRPLQRRKQEQQQVSARVGAARMEKGRRSSGRLEMGRKKRQAEVARMDEEGSEDELAW